METCLYPRDRFVADYMYIRVIHSIDYIDYVLCSLYSEQYLLFMCLS